MNYNWDTSFTKGWTSEQRWQDYLAARDAGKYFEMDCIIRAEGAERRPVDARIFGSHCPDKDLYQKYNSEPYAFDSSEKDREFRQLEELVKIRDIPLSEVPKEFPEDLWKLSYFAHHITIDPYVKGVDYMVTGEEYERVQAGFHPGPTARGGTLRQIETGRDLATYVHTDNPMSLWISVVNELFAMGVPYRTEFDQVHTLCREDVAFATWGTPFWWGLIGEIIQRCGLVNFRSKHEFMACRPEEYAIKRYGKLLPMTFAEGSPMHGSFRAMHDVIARACAAAIVYIFDKHFPIMARGEESTVGEEVLRLAGNVSDGRQWAAVHFEEDNRKGIPVATAIGERVAQEHLDRQQPFAITF